MDINALLSRELPDTPENAEWMRGVRDAAEILRGHPRDYKRRIEALAADAVGWYGEGVEAVISTLWQSGEWF